MANNVEKFVIDLGFSAKDLKQLKELLKLQEQSQKAAKVHNKQQRDAKAKELAMERKKLQMLKLIAKAEKEGVDVSKYKRSLAAVKSIATLEKRRIELDELHFKAKEANDKKRQEAKQKELATEKKITKEITQRQFNNMPPRKLFEKAQAARDKALRSSAEHESLADSYARQTATRARRIGLSEGQVESLKEQARAAYGTKAAMQSLNATLGELSLKQREATMRARKHNIALQGLNDSTRHLIRSYASLYAVIGSTSFIIKTGQEFEQMEAGMLAASETAELAKTNLEFLRKESMRLGFDLAKASKGFVKLSAAAQGKVSNEDIQKSFIGITEAATVFQLSMDDTIGSIRAVQQMFSKDGIMAEEFKMQLGDRIPIAMRALEKSTGKTSKELLKMMEMGQLGIEYIVPFTKALGDLANQNDALAKSMETSGKQQDRFINLIKISANTIYEGDMEEAYVELLKASSSFMEYAEDSFKALGKIFSFIFNVVRSIGSVVLPIISSFVYLLGEVADLFNKVFFDSSIVHNITAIATAIYGIAKAVGLVNAALKTQIGLRAASLALNPAGIAAVGGAILAEDTYKSVKDPHAQTGLNTNPIMDLFHAIKSPFTEEGTSGFLSSRADSIKNNYLESQNTLDNMFNYFNEKTKRESSLAVEIKAEEGFQAKIVDKFNADAKVEVW